jgi:uncharacterized protein involved in exopolysaccharide biosynthesis
MEQVHILDVLRRHVWMIVALAIVATPAGYFGSFLLEKKYTSSALVLVRPQESIKLETRSSSNKEFLDFPMAQSTAVETPSKTYIEIIKSPALIGQVVRTLSLDKAEDEAGGTFSKYLPASMKPMIDELKHFLKNAVKIVKYGSVIPEDKFADAVSSIQDNLSLEARTDTYIFTIKYSAKTPELAAEVANTAAKLFIEYMEKIHRSEGKYVIERLQAQLRESRQLLEDARQGSETFKKANAILSYQSEYDAKLNVISKLQSDIAKADEALAAFKVVAKENAQSMIILKERRNSLYRTLQEKQAEVASLPEIERQVKRLELAEKVALAAYETVGKAVKEAEIKNSYSAPEVLLVSEATPPHLPSAPNRMLIAMVSLLGALMVGMGLAFLLEFLDRSIRSVRDVEDHVGIKVLATIPCMPATRSRAAGP